METLPKEIIELILINPDLSIVDVVNFSSTCYKFREIVNSSRCLWKIKYFQRWPERDFDIECEDWYAECITRRCFEKQVLEMLSSMSSKFFNLDIRSIGSLHLEFTSSLINSNKYGYYYLRDFLIYINSLPLTQFLTNKYYGNILLKYLHKKQCKEFWNNLMKLNVKEQTLEKGAMFVSLWYQEHERGIWEAVFSELDAIAIKVKQHLLHCFPDHPLKNVPEEVESVWKRENLTGNVFQPQDCKSVIWAINFVLFKELKYCVTYDFNDFNGDERKQYGIYNALLYRKATPIIYAVIHESIARRLGVKIEVVEFSDHCLLRWKEDYSAENSATHYVSSSSETIFIRSRCPGNPNNNTRMPACNMQQIAQKAALDERKEKRSVWEALELVLVINPFSMECFQQLYQSCSLGRIDAKELIMKLKDIRRQISDVEWRWYEPLLQAFEEHQQKWENSYSKELEQNAMIRHRVEGINFAVGMIVRSKTADDIGVICGWDVDVLTVAGVPSREVFYKVLIDDGDFILAPQGSLQILHSPPFFYPPFVGRFFDEYCMTYYRPNKELQAIYPQEMEALQSILKRDRHTLNLHVPVKVTEKVLVKKNCM